MVVLTIQRVMAAMATMSQNLNRPQAIEHLAILPSKMLVIHPFGAHRHPLSLQSYRQAIVAMAGGAALIVSVMVVAM
jgi:hypothetical protein